MHSRRYVLKAGLLTPLGAATGAALLPQAIFGQSLPAGTRRVLPGIDDRKAIQDAIDALELEGGGVVELVAGTYRIASRLVIHNVVCIRGSNGRNTEIQPAAGYSDAYMFEFRNPTPTGYGSQFSCRLENLAIKALGNNSISAVVWGPSWNEQCGLRNVLIFDFARHAVLFTDGFGGSATIEFRECEFQAAATATSGYAALLLGATGTTGYTNVLLEHVVVTGAAPTAPGYVGIDARSGIQLVVTGLHIEDCDDGVALSGRSGLTASGLTGSPTHVGNLITCGSDFSGKVFGAGVLRAGATGHVLHDNKNGRHIATERNPLVFP
jgi:hypothetical protein